MGRDLNAALNIFNGGMANYPELMPAEDDTPKPPAQPAGRRRHPMKQESTIKHCERTGLNKNRKAA